MKVNDILSLCAVCDNITYFGVGLKRLHSKMYTDFVDFTKYLCVYINSHLWANHDLCRQVKATYCVCNKPSLKAKFDFCTSQDKRYIVVSIILHIFLCFAFVE